MRDTTRLRASGLVRSWFSGVSCHLSARPRSGPSPRRSCGSGFSRIARALLAVALATPVLASADVIDRVVATVGTRTITLSDVRAAVALGIVPGGAAPESADPAPATVDALVDRELVWIEVDRFSPGAPAESAVDDRLAAISDRLGEGELEKVMARAGLDRPALRALVREQLQIEGYLADRFGAAAQPTEEEVRVYFRDHAEQFVKNGAAMSFDEAEPLARAALSDARRRELIDSWIAGLRRRTPVVIRTAPPEGSVR